MKLSTKAYIAIFINSLYSLGVIMFRLILMILVIFIIYCTFNGGLNFKVNDKSYQFQIETKGSK